MSWSSFAAFAVRLGALPVVQLFGFDCRLKPVHGSPIQHKALIQKAVVRDITKRFNPERSFMVNT